MLQLSSTPKTYSLCRLALVTSIVCGLEFCASVALSYVPSMLLKAGLLEQHMTLVMGLGPFFGFFICPIIGRLSDNCQCQYGRRKPFIVVLSISILLALGLIYYSQIILFENISVNNSTELINTQKHSRSIFGTFLLIFSCVLLDFASQASFNPIESLLLDMCQGTDREHTCFTIYSFMNSLGGCLGYLITGISWNAVYLFISNSEIPNAKHKDDVHEAAEKDLYQERSVFSILAFLFFLFALTTLLSGKDSIKQIDEKDEDNVSLLVDSNDTQNLHKYTHSSYESRKRGLLSLIKYGCTEIIMKFGVIISMFKMPDSLKRLALADCASWTGLICFTLFYMDYVGQAVYEGNPAAPSGTIERLLYDEGIRAASWGLFYHCIVAMIYVCFINRIIAKFGLINTFAVSIFSFTLSMLVITYSKDIIIVNIMASLTGIALASVTTIPYAIVTLYHSNKRKYYSDLSSFGVERGVGGDMAMLDSAYFLSQIVLSVTISYIVHITGTVKCYIITAGILSIFAIFCIKRIKL